MSGFVREGGTQYDGRDIIFRPGHYCPPPPPYHSRANVGPKKPECSPAHLAFSHAHSIPPYQDPWIYYRFSTFSVVFQPAPALLYAPFPIAVPPVPLARTPTTQRKPPPGGGPDLQRGRVSPLENNSRARCFLPFKIPVK